MSLIWVLNLPIAFGLTSDKDVRIYEVNKFGQTQYHKKSVRIKSGTVYEVDKYGNTQYHKPKGVSKKVDKK